MPDQPLSQAGVISEDQKSLLPLRQRVGRREPFPDRSVEPVGGVLELARGGRRSQHQAQRPRLDPEALPLERIGRQATRRRCSCCWKAFQSTATPASQSRPRVLSRKAWSGCRVGRDGAAREDDLPAVLSGCSPDEAAQRLSRADLEQDAVGLRQQRPDSSAKRTGLAEVARPVGGIGRLPALIQVPVTFERKGIAGRLQRASAATAPRQRADDRLHHRASGRRARCAAAAPATPAAASRRSSPPTAVQRTRDDAEPGAVDRGEGELRAAAAAAAPPRAAARRASRRPAAPRSAGPRGDQVAGRPRARARRPGRRPRTRRGCSRSAPAAGSPQAIQSRARAYSTAKSAGWAKSVRLERGRRSRPGSAPSRRRRSIPPSCGASASSGRIEERSRRSTPEVAARASAAQTVERLAEDRLACVEPARHAGYCSPEPGKQEGDRRGRAVSSTPSTAASGLARGERAGRLRGVPADHGAPVLEGAAAGPGGCRPRRPAARVRMRRQMLAQGGRRGVQRGRGCAPRGAGAARGATAPRAPAAAPPRAPRGRWCRRCRTS